MNEHAPRSSRVGLLLCSLFAALVMAGCGVESVVEPADSAAAEISIFGLCTPGYQMCDTCWVVGGNSAEDCIVQCNAQGTGWIEVENCGWAQNFPYSSSCYPSQPPRCEWN